MKKIIKEYLKNSGKKQGDFFREKKLCSGNNSFRTIEKNERKLAELRKFLGNFDHDVNVVKIESDEQGI